MNAPALQFGDGWKVRKGRTRAPQPELPIDDAFTLKREIQPAHEPEIEAPTNSTPYLFTL